MKSLSKFWVLALLMCGAGTVTAQSSLKDDEAHKATEVKNLVNSGRYTFETEKVSTQKGGSRQVGYGTDLDISRDTLIVYLPDAGKTPGTPVSARAAGITYVHFSYNMMPAANGGYNVSIIPQEKYPKEVNDIKKISMHISKEGYTDLTVTTADHGLLEYHGYIMQHQALFPGAKNVASNY
jgi:hypothetical protein